MSKEAYYFKHFCNARSDRKIRKARLQLGIEAYAIYFMLLEVLRDQKDFKFPLADLDILANDFDTSIQKIETIIRVYGLFEIDAGEQFFSIAQIKSLEAWLQIKEINRLKGQKSGIARRKKLENELVKLSQLDSSQPRFNNCSTAVELREEKKDNTTTKNYTLNEKNFFVFKESIRVQYKGDGDKEIYPTLFLDGEKEIGVNANGLLYIKGGGETFAPDKAKELWQFIFVNQNQIIPIEPQIQAWELKRNNKFDCKRGAK